MKKTKALTTKLLEELERTPLIQTACEKIGISRNTFYRWINEDEELFEQANHALSLGMGLVNDVALSNVLSGIKNKDTKYTIYWLSHKHQDFRRPFRDRVDADDPIQYRRLLNEKEQVIRVQMEAKELAEKPTKEKMEEAIRKVTEFQDRWFVDEHKEREEIALQKFEEWKKEYLENGNEPPKIT